MSSSAVAWITLMLALALSTFGVGGTIVFSLCITSVVLGLLFVFFHQGHKEYIIFLKNLESSRLAFPAYNLHQFEQELKNGKKKMRKQDRRMTGSIIIDEQLHEIMQYALRDFVQNWYSAISEDEEFTNEIGKAAQEAIISFSNRSKEINWIPYITTQLVDDFASHLRLFRKTQQKLKHQRLDESCQKSDVNTIFFTFELEMEDNMSRDGICTNSDNESALLRDVVDILLFLLLSPVNFESTVCRQFLREIIVHNLILPTLETFTDPDYINQLIIWMCKDLPVTSEVFLTIIKSTDSIDELIATQESINHEIAVQRSKDTGGERDAEIKQRLSSLHYVKKVVETKMQRLNDGSEETDSFGLPSQIDWNKWLNSDQKLPDLSLDFILKNNITLSYFMDYMTSVNSQAYLFFYLNVEGYKVSAEQQLSAAHLNGTDSTQIDLDGLRQAALNIYQTCLSEEATPRLIILDNHQNDITTKVTKKLLMRIRTDPEPSDRWFDEAQFKIYEMFLSISKFFPSFKRTHYYVKLLAELDLLKDPNRSDEEDVVDGRQCDAMLEPLDEDIASLGSFEQEDSSLSDVMSISSGGSGSLMNSEAVGPAPSHIMLTADITGVAKETIKTKSFIMYKIRVLKSDDVEGIQDEWVIYRRYSDFLDFHMILLNKFEGVNKVNFPGKKAFNNMNRSFLQKRMRLLKDYLLTIQSPYVLSTNKGLKDFLHQFLSKGQYEKEKSIIARRVEDIVKPLKTVKEAVMNVPDNFVDGVKAGINRALINPRMKQSSHLDEQSGKVGAALLDPENVSDNIPLRIMLLLMDEVFDLKSRNLWLRRRIITLLRQIIKATYEDMINRKIIDYVQWMLSAEQVSEYIRSFKESFWPNGILATPYPERDKSTKMRTRVAAKVAMLCVFSDELKHVIGSETFRKGILCIFEMFQNRTLNKRLMYVFLEGVLATLFYSNNFKESFHKLHSHFQKIKKKTAK